MSDVVPFTLALRICYDLNTDGGFPAVFLLDYQERWGKARSEVKPDERLEERRSLQL